MRRVLITLLLSAGILGGGVVPAGAAPGDPVGSFDSASIRLAKPGSAERMPFIIRGWAADPDAPGELPELHVYLDGRRYPSQVPTREPRPDVQAAYPFAGANSGWVLPIDLGDSNPHHVCIYAINRGAGSSNTTLGCKTTGLNAGPTNGDPRAHLDAVGFRGVGLVQVRGWAFNPDSPEATRVRVYIGGQAATDMTTSVARPDVSAAFPQAHPRSGFDFVLPFFHGDVTICVYAGNAGPEGVNNTTAGCGRARLGSVPPRTPGTPRGHTDHHYTAEKETRGNAFDGWAFDPDSASEIMIRSRALLIGPEGFFYEIKEFRTDRPRPDVEQLHPEAPPNPGFRDFYESDRRYRPAVLYRCYYAIGVPDNAEHWIGCPQLFPE